MAKTLHKLSSMAGHKYYVVATEEMERRARSKVKSLDYQIDILLGYE
jgi:hypothetical protein